MLKYGDRIGIVCCSNGHKPSYGENLKRLETILLKMGLRVTFFQAMSRLQIPVE